MDTFGAHWRASIAFQIINLNGFLYAFDSSSMEKYDPLKRCWKEVRPLNWNSCTNTNALQIGTSGSEVFIPGSIIRGQQSYHECDYCPWRTFSIIGKWGIRTNRHHRKWQIIVCPLGQYDTWMGTH